MRSATAEKLRCAFGVLDNIEGCADWSAAAIISGSRGTHKQSIATLHFTLHRIPAMNNPPQSTDPQEEELDTEIVSIRAESKPESTIPETHNYGR